MTRKPLVAGMTIGGVLAVATHFSAVGTIGDMIQAYAVLGPSGVRDPSARSAALSEILGSHGTGLSLFVAGLALFATCLIAFLVRGKKPPLAPDAIPPLR